MNRERELVQDPSLMTLPSTERMPGTGRQQVPVMKISPAAAGGYTDVDVPRSGGEITVL